MGTEIQDVGGLGVIAGHIKELILKFFEYWSQRSERQLKHKTLRLQNTRELLQLANDFHITPEQVKYYENLAHEQKPLSDTAPYILKIGQYSENHLSVIHNKAQ